MDCFNIACGILQYPRNIGEPSVYDHVHIHGQSSKCVADRSSDLHLVLLCSAKLGGRSSHVVPSWVVGPLLWCQVRWSLLICSAILGGQSSYIVPNGRKYLTKSFFIA